MVLWGTWFRFHLPSGESLFLVGFIDLMITFSRIFESYALCIFKEDRLPLTEFSHHLDFMEWAQLGLETSKLLLNIIFWIGGLIQGRQKLLTAWIYISIILEIIIQLLIWTVQYHDHLWQIDVKTIPILKLTYYGLIRLAIRIYLIVTVIQFVRKVSGPVGANNISSQPKVSSNSIETTAGGSGLLTIVESLPSPIQISHTVLGQVPEDVEMLPVGSGFMKIFKFYYTDISRILRLLITLDLSWGVYRLLANELPQLLFGRHMKILPSSSFSTPILTEERIIRIFRMIIDTVFIRNILNGRPPLEALLIIPKLIEIFVSFGILIFLRVAEYDIYPPLVFNIFYVLYILDILFRIGTFALCYKAYGDYLCLMRRNAVANAKSRAQLLITGNK